MGIVSKIGRWLDKRFPEQMSVEEVNARFESIQSALMSASELKSAVITISNGLNTAQAHFSDLENTVKEMKSELNKLKVIMEIKQAGTVKMPNLTGSEAWKR